MNDPDLTRLTISVAQHINLTRRFPRLVHVEGVDHAGVLPTPSTGPKGYEGCSVKIRPGAINRSAGIAVIRKYETVLHVRCAAIESALKGENKHDSVLIVVMEPYQTNVYYITMKRPSETQEGPEVRPAKRKGPVANP
jgi:hypothetical protein